MSFVYSGFSFSNGYNTVGGIVGAAVGQKFHVIDKLVFKYDKDILRSGYLAKSNRKRPKN
jgi:hypothetical protein